MGTFGSGAFGWPYPGGSAVGVSAAYTLTATDTGVTNTDSLVRLAKYFRTPSDTGVTNTDSLSRIKTRPRSLSDTGVTNTDSLSDLAVHFRTTSDTGLTLTESLTERRARPLTDTGITQTDTLALIRLRGRSASDTGLTQTDSLVNFRYRVLADTGVSHTDTLADTRVRVLSDTGLTQTDYLDAVQIVSAYPTSDITTGNWYYTPLYSKVDDNADLDDGLYIYSSPSPITPDIAELALSSLSDPNRHDYHTIRYSISKNSSDDNIELTVRLMQGATEIASWTETLTTSTAIVEHTLSEAEAASITNYGNLRIKLEAVAV